MRLRNCLAGKIAMLVGWLTRVGGPDLGASAVRVYLLKDLQFWLFVREVIVRAVFTCTCCGVPQRSAGFNNRLIGLREVSKSYIYC